VVEQLPSKNEALSSNPSATGKKRENGLSIYATNNSAGKQMVKKKSEN
jgi:hypothetical protein